jgi:hypothetical protein
VVLIDHETRLAPDDKAIPPAAASVECPANRVGTGKGREMTIIFAQRAHVGFEGNTNGWSFWQYKDSGGKKVTLFDARAKFLRMKGGAYYLFRLRERMEKVGFLPNHDLYQHVCAAHEAVCRLSIKAH